TVMSDYEDSTVTYTALSSPFRGLSDIRSPRALPSPHYVPGPEYPPSPNFVLEPVNPEFMPPEDEVLPAEEQPLPAVVSPTADSSDYVPESDLKEDPEEDDDKDPKEDLADYPADKGDDGDDEDESSDDDKDDDAPSAKETEPFETDESVATPPPHPAYCITARISIRDEPPIPFWPDTEVARLLAIPTPRPSPLSPWSSPLPQIPSPLLPPILSPLPVLSPPPASPTYLLGYKVAMIRLRAEAPADIPEVTLPPQKRLGIALGPRYEVGEGSSAPTARPPGGFRDEMLVDMPRAPATDDTELGRRMTQFTTRVRQDTYEIYTRLDDEQTERQLMAGRLNMMYKDKRAHARTARLMEAEAGLIIELQAADRRRQEAITDMLASNHRRHAQFIEVLKLLKRLQTQMTEFERQQGPAKGPAQPDAPKEAGSSS
ncbi:hypothetical protein Tco_0837253, partial [Tanacetum coccineum]